MADRLKEMVMKAWKDGFLLAMLAIFVPQKANAVQEWIDITSQYITNYTFDGNTNQGWEFSWRNGTCNNRVDAMEFWNSTFDIHQNLMNLSAGHYKVSVQSFFRCKDNQNGYQDYQNGSENVTGYLYAGTNEKKLVSVYAQSFTENLEGSCWGYSTGDWWNQTTIYFPNTMESGTRAFKDGYYWNELEFDHDGGDLIIGLRNDEYINNNWCLFDNFKIEYFGEVVPITKLTITPTILNLLIGDTYQLIATITPENATYKTLTWASSDESIATVDENGVITAVDEGNVRISARSTDGSNKVVYVMVRITSNPATKESLIINEIMASNVDQWISPAFNFDGWIELYNPTDDGVGINNFYFSDTPSNLKLWRAPSNMGTIPPHGYRIVWFDSGTLNRKNTTFKLDEDGGTIYISDSKGNLIVQQDYPASMERVSYARTTDGGEEWSTTSNPTPQASNNTSTFALMQLAAPIVDQPSQLFVGTLTVNVEIPTGCTLRYTTDGTLPTMTNGATSRTGQFSINNTEVYRFRLFADDYLASPVTSRSYIYHDMDYTLPIVSVISDPKFLYDDSIGVYVKGTNGRPGNGQSSKCNWNMDWERPVNFSYITLEDGMVLNQDVNLEMCGGWSRAWTPHSFKLKGSKELGGNKNLNYPFFEEKPYIRNRTLQIRNGGNNNGD
ncbi:MAG: Ig-like domain-containing protein, partial [Prevotella sp.]|nr:Ig-like domain-containing protein [Prevotella sp.]